MVAQFPQTLPANSVVGRLGTGPGPSEAVPFNKLSLALASNTGTEISVKVFGAQGDGSTNDTAAFNTCYEFCSTNNIGMAIPPGTYIVNGLVWNQFVNVRGSGSLKTIFKPLGNNITTITAVGVGNATRDHITEMGHFSVDSGGMTGVVGIHFQGMNYGHISDITSINNDTGIHIEGGNFTIWDKLTGNSSNNAGLRLTDDLTGVNGGGNSMQFNNCDFSNNLVGIVAGRPGMPFPMGSNVFINPIVQTNSLCAVYLFEQGATSFHNFAPEANGTGGAGSAVLYGQTVTKSSIQMIGADVLFTCYSDDSPTVPVLVQTSSFVRWIESSAPLLLSVDTTSTSDFQGTCTNGAAVTNTLLDLTDPLNGTTAQLGAVLPTTNIVDQSFPNTFPSPSFPAPLDFNCASVGFDTDPSLGLVTTATFNASAGSSTSNRVRYTSSDAVYPIASNIYLSFLINSSQTGNFEFFSGSGIIDYGPVTLTAGVWTRILAKNYNSTGVTLPNNLTIFPNDNHGATIKLARFVCLINPTPLQVRLLSRDHRYNPRDKQGFRNIMSSVPTVGTWVVGDIVWNSAPAPSGTIGWVCTTGGTPGTWKTWGSISA